MMPSSIAYSVSGNDVKGTMIALHGVTDNAASLADIAAHWGASYRVVLVDTLGHGLSRPFTVAELNDPFAAMIEAVAPVVIEAARTSSTKRVVILGHSLGGAIATHLTDLYPEIVSCCILEDPALLTQSQWELYRAGAAELVTRQELVSEHVGDAIGELMRAYPRWPVSEYGAWAQGKTQVDRDFVSTGVVGNLGREVLARLRVPTLIVTGDGEDVLFGQDGVAQLPKQQNPLLSSALISGASHCVRRDQSAAFYRIVDLFLANHLALDSTPAAYIDPELQPIITATPKQDLSDVERMRREGDRLLGDSTLAPSVSVKSLHHPRGNGTELRILQFGKRSTYHRVLISLHGGGYVAGAARYDDERNAILGEALECQTVIAPEYSLAPEHPWPAAINDCRNAILFAKEEFPGAPLVLFGDSAGAGLAQQVLRVLHQEGLGDSIEKAVLLEPCLEGQMTTASFATYSDGPIWTRAASTDAWRMYRGTSRRAYPYTPSISAGIAMPPTLIVVNPVDPLRDEGVNFATLLADCGVPVELHMLPGTFHGSLGAGSTQVWEQLLSIIQLFVSKDFRGGHE